MLKQFLLKMAISHIAPGYISFTGNQICIPIKFINKKNHLKILQLLL